MWVTICLSRYIKFCRWEVDEKISQETVLVLKDKRRVNTLDRNIIIVVFPDIVFFTLFFLLFTPIIITVWGVLQNWVKKMKSYKLFRCWSKCSSVWNVTTHSWLSFGLKETEWEGHESKFEPVFFLNSSLDRLKPVQYSLRYRSNLLFLHLIESLFLSPPPPHLVLLEYY